MIHRGRPLTAYVVQEYVKRVLPTLAIRNSQHIKVPIGLTN